LQATCRAPRRSEKFPPPARSDGRGECWLNPRARVYVDFVGSDLAFFFSCLWFSDPVANITGHIKEHVLTSVGHSR
jgi:hypothetical protein